MFSCFGTMEEIIKVGVDKLLSGFVKVQCHPARWTKGIIQETIDKKKEVLVV